MLVQIDSREKDRVKSASQYFKNQGLEVEVCELQIGDYLFDEKVCFEFKLVSDFVASIQDSRVFNQSIEMAENYDWSFVVIHGDLATRSKCLAMSKHYRKVTIFQYLSAIASLDKYTSVIETYSPYLDESYYRMMTHARKCLINKPVVKRFPKKDKNPAMNFLCHDVYGINHKKGKAIIDHNNLQSLNDLFNLKLEDLTEIDGIGENTANRILTAIHGDQK